MTKEPFIHLFTCSTGFYLYDVNTDSILKIKQSTYDCLKNRQYSNSNQQIIKLKQAGFLKSNHVQISEHPATQLLPSFYASRLNSLILQVTQNCNLRCDYCIYSGKYNTRTHSNKKMDFNMAKSGIDFIFLHSKDCQGVRIGFYGGEPLLEFNLIKKCVDYVEKKANGKEAVYLVTTNATLLSAEIVAFLVKHNFQITVSFDGPKKIHDKHRRFADGNKGSYDIVMKNVKYIRDNYYDYFKKNVNFNTVLNPQEGYACIGNYLNGEELFKDASFTAGIVSDAGIKSKESLSEEFSEEYNYEYFKLLMSKLGRVKEEHTSIIVREQFEFLGRMREGKHQGGVTELPKKWHHGGPCIPGERAIFLNTDGNFYPCEKVCEKAEMAIMGNVKEGIDINKAYKILNIEKTTEKECRNCWAYQYCNFCIRYAEENSEKLKVNMLTRCQGMRNDIERVFKDYCVMRELGYDFETNKLVKNKGIL